jgi:hypothetical protein
MHPQAYKPRPVSVGVNLLMGRADWLIVSPQSRWWQLLCIHTPCILAPAIFKLSRITSGCRFLTVCRHRKWTSTRSVRLGGREPVLDHAAGGRQLATALRRLHGRCSSVQKTPAIQPAAYNIQRTPRSPAGLVQTWSEIVRADGIAGLFSGARPVVRVTCRAGTQSAPRGTPLADIRSESDCAVLLVRLRESGSLHKPGDQTHDIRPGTPHLP